MNYILKGDPKEVAKVLQENRIRVDRGVIAFTPCQQDSALDADSIATLREALEASEKSCQEMAQGHVVLASVTRDVIAIIAENGISVPEDLAERLAQFGIDVPKIAETVPNTAEIADNSGESVPDTVPNNPENVEDNKTVEAEDMTEVNLDDVKDIEEADTKVAPATTPKKKTRSKKS
jgi:hypothetical protein|nr:MAG TPA: hypothetical protein [Caudoviricetes sp.]